MDVKRYIDKCKVIGKENPARLILTGNIHPTTDSHDTQLFYNWTKMAIREGVDKITVCLGDKPNTWVVTVKDKQEG